MCMLTLSASEIDFTASAQNGDTHSHDMVDTNGAPFAGAAVAATNKEPPEGKYHVSAQPPIGGNVEAPRTAASAGRGLAVGGDGRTPYRGDPDDVDSAPDVKKTGTTSSSDGDSSSWRGSSAEEDKDDSSAWRANSCSALEGVAGSPLCHDEQSGAEGGRCGEGMTPPATNGSSSSNSIGNITYRSSVPSTADESRGITTPQQQRDDSRDASGRTEGVAAGSNKGSSSSLLGTDHSGENEANTKDGEENLLSPRVHDPWAPYAIVTEADPVASWEVLHQVRDVTAVQVATFDIAGKSMRCGGHDHHNVVARCGGGFLCMCDEDFGGLYYFQ